MNTILSIFTFLGALGLFLYGMTTMSDALQHLAGDRLRNLLARMTSNPFKGILTGMGITSVIQSSSATTVMVVSFVNAGLISLAGAISIIMGANIGTTITAWIVSLLGFRFSIATFCLPLVAVATVLMFIKRYKPAGMMIFGFAMLFYGLDLMSEQIPDFTLPQYSGITASIASLADHGYLSVLLFVAIGTVSTVILQSSSAMMAVTLVMCNKGLIGFDMACALCLGENIGTTITANLAALVANRMAKRTARAHLIFNLVGVIWVLALFHPILMLVRKIALLIGSSDPYLNMTGIPMALSCFHSFFNIANTMLLVWFIPQMTKVLYKLIPVKEEEEAFRLKHISTSRATNSSVCLGLAKKEIEVFSERCVRMYGFVQKLAETNGGKDFDQLAERIKKYEGITDRMEIEIAQYITRVAEGGLTTQESREAESMLRIVDNLESIGDECYHISLTLASQRRQSVDFDSHMKDNLNIMIEQVQRSLDEMDSNLHKPYSAVIPTPAEQLEETINGTRDQLREEHTAALRENRYNYAEGQLYSSLYAQLEKIGDYVVNITQAITRHKYK